MCNFYIISILQEIFYIQDKHYYQDNNDFHIESIQHSHKLDIFHFFLNKENMNYY